MRRVVVTGVGGLCGLGSSWPDIHAGLRARRNSIRVMREWDRYTDMTTRVAGPIDFTPPPHWTRRQLRSMGRVSQLAVRAAEIAIDDAGLAGDPAIGSDMTGIACGSSTGSTPDIKDFAAMIINNDTSGLNANTYVRMMPHTTAANIGIFFGAKGRIIPTSSACTSGSQGIGYAYEAIKYGRQTLMLAGGAEELCPTEAMAFDTLYATSRRNDHPETTPRPYDRDRDGLVVGEGSAIMVLEELEHARARGARIHAEIVGFGSNSDGVHVTRPAESTMRRVMELALEDAGISLDAIGYVSGHGTATEHGDIAETRATAALFGSRMPLSSQKGYIGHTLGACGALEAWFSVAMMNQGWFAPNLNLEHVDPRCGELDYIVGAGRELQVSHVMNNNFAFGGVNTSMIFRRWEADSG